MSLHNALPSPSKGRITVLDFLEAKRRGNRWAVLTAYDYLTARVFEEAGIPILLVGDSSAMVVFGHDTTLPLSVDQMIPLVQAVVRGARRAMIVADLPFGSYELSPEQALASAVRLMKEGGAHAVKIEGGAAIARHVELLVRSGIPTIGHVGLTPQHVHALGGFKVQGRGDAGDIVLDDAKRLEDAGAFAVLIEAVPAELGLRITQALAIPTIGIGAGSHCDAQVLVWQDMLGLTDGSIPKFVKRYANLRTIMRDAARLFADEVATGAFPTDAHVYR
jgi:3-methyl-2-oxobutanoate hydroxymethyltransferase